MPGGRPPGRPPVAILIIALATGLIAAGSRADSLATCRALADPDARLACYDGLADQAGTPATGDPPAGPAAPATVAPRVAAAVAPHPEDLFGLDAAATAAALGAATAATPPDSLTATITAVDRTTDGKLVFTLANGQAWLQVDSRAASAGSGETARIQRAAFGSYLLSAGDRGRGIRVRRIR